jgi:hypothetical protein
MFVMTEHEGAMREPDTLPEAWPRWEYARGTQARIRRAEDAWAMHAVRATGFGAGEAAYVERDG